MTRKKFGLTLETRQAAENSAAEQTITEKIAEINNPQTSMDPFGYKLVPFHKIVRNEKNDYEMNNLTSLKESILKGELLHNFDVKYNLEKDVYILISGERRYTAIKMLQEEFENADSKSISPERLELYKENVEPFFTLGLPCKILNRRKQLDEIDELILLNEANLEVRELSPAKKAAKIAELQDLYKKRNKRDGKSESVQEQVADTLQISKRQVQQYTAINEKLIPELKEQFDNEQITVKEGSTFAQLDPEGQRSILDIIKRHGKVENNDMAAVKEEQRLREQKINELEKELEEKTLKLNTAVEDAARAQEKNNALLVSLNKTREEFAQKEKTLREELTKELEQDNSENIDTLKQQIEKIESEKKSLEKHITDIEQQNTEKEQSLKKLQNELVAAKKISPPASDLTSDEKKLIKYNYELNKTVDEIKNLLSTAEKAILEIQRLETTLPPDLSNNINYINRLLELNEQIN